MGFHLFNLFIPYYGFCIAIGVISSFLTGIFLTLKNKSSTDELIIIFVYLLSFGFLGAKILYIIVTFKYIDFSEVFSSLEYFVDFLASGFVFYGGLLAGFAALFLVQKIHSIQIKNHLNVITICLAICHAFGRLGCSLTGCCFGKETSGPLYFLYKNSTVAPNNIKLFPVQGIEAVCILLLALILIIIFVKHPEFTNWPVYFISYSILRFILEFFRGDVIRGNVGVLSTSQIISILILSAIIVFLIVKNSISSKKNIQ